MRKNDEASLMSREKPVNRNYQPPIMELQMVTLEESLCTGSAELRFGSEGAENTIRVELWDQNTGWSQTADLDL